MLRLFALLSFALITAGCSNVAGLFGSSSGSGNSSSLLSDGASAVADHGSDIFDAAKNALSGPSYCQKAGSTQVYKVDDGDCATGDTAIKSYEYNQRLAQNQENAWQQLHAAALAEADKPTYCETTTSHTAYRPLSGQCQAGEQTISAQQYDADRAKAAAAWTQVP
jgi:hypothetical protein